jgi:hypothetical protein
MLVVPSGTSKVGTGVGTAVEGVGISLVPVISVVGRKAMEGTNCGRLVGEAVGGGVSVGVGVMVGVLLGVGEGPGVSVAASVGIGVFVGGRAVLVGSISVAAMATAEAISVGVGSPSEAVT